MTSPTDRILLAIDQGTSATKAVLIDAHGQIVDRGSAPLERTYPQPGWVEQSAEDIWTSLRSAVAACLAGRNPADVAGIGLSTQRESLLLWERTSHRPVGPMISWQDQRTAADCARLRETGADELVRTVSGLPLDPMFSALKARWLLDRYDPDRVRSHHGELCLGTVDSWLLTRLGGDHVIEVGNAARTQLLDVRRRTWDPRLLDLFGVPAEVLPTVLPSQGPFGRTRGLAPLPDGVPIAAVMGDSHAALFAHAGWRRGQVKATYGTGSSVMGVVDPSVAVPEGLTLTIGWDADGAAYALEGNIRSTGATLSWLASCIETTPEALAEAAAETSEGLHLVPAFSGLGAPWWDDEAVGLLTGLTFATRVPHIARAALESIAFQVEDVVAAVERDAGSVQTLLADGGPTSNRVLMQLQADTSGRVVERATARDLSALGVAHLAGLTVGLWDWKELEGLDRDRQVFRPAQGEATRTRRIAAWHDAVSRSRFRPARPVTVASA
jgi:glycerol kinase